MPTIHMQQLLKLLLRLNSPPQDSATFFIKGEWGDERRWTHFKNRWVYSTTRKKTSLWLFWDFRILCFYFYKNRLICLRLLLSITAGSPGERWEAENSGNLPKEKSMKQINPSQAAMTQ